jgi:galactose mutarotase-like enzyme
MPYRQLFVSGFPAIALRTGEVEVVAVPAIGMKLTNLRRLKGREWLWRSDQIPLAPPVPGASYVETADSGGWDECFPTVGPSPLPGAPAGTPPLPDHGELWSANWTSSVYEHAGETTLAATARGTLLPYEFHREITVEALDPVVRFRYRLRHTGGAPFPWIWSSHPLFAVQPGTVLELPTVTQVKLDAVHGRDDLTRGDVVSWPGAISGGGTAFTFPEPPEQSGWAVKLFGDVGPSGRMALVDPRRGERLEITVRPAEVPQVGVWINCGGWAPAGRRPYYNLALEPCIGAPDRLDDAVSDWKLAQTLSPGEERTWSLEVRLPDD